MMNYKVETFITIIKHTKCFYLICQQFNLFRDITAGATGATRVAEGQNLPPLVGNRVKAPENLSATAVAPVAPAVMSLPMATRA